ncbi:MAG: hypothetical protein IPM79_06980 [Polyangiaceae bacterium]|jgi:hypothetical protein|nr:hypothetical protein [Polyangiaceae bacterium]MBK8937381.1 hypothetical protein [Polyangiaceae bacterium]
MKQDPKEQRQGRLEDAAKAEGECWAREQMGVLRAEHRPIIGGWPGTMGEARGRSRRCVAQAFGRNSAAPTFGEVESAARLMYARAKHVWRTVTEREPAP